MAQVRRCKIVLLFRFNMHQICWLWLTTSFAAVSLLLTAPAYAEFIKGADLSTLKAAEDGGVQYKIDGVVTDPLLIFKRNGCNCIRLRLFVNPSGKDGQVNTLAYTLALAKRVKAADLSLLLDFHYSDAWADPGHQSMPADWKSLTHVQLVRKVHDYTLEVLKAFQTNGCLPQIVSIGNEITDGMLFPDGGPLKSNAKWTDFTELLAAGVRAARETAPASQLRIMIHIDRGAVGGVSEWFFSHCEKAKLDFDLIGLSYYPFWHGNPEALAANMAALSAKYHKDIVIAETSYSYLGEQGKLPYPTTPLGQQAYLENLMRTVAATPGGHGGGVIYWEAALIQHTRWSGSTLGPWEGRALFDSSGNALPAMSAFKFTPGLTQR